MGKYESRCKYCGIKITGGTVCGACGVKLPLVRQLRGMVRDAKDKIDREQRIKDDLRKVRNNDL